MADKGYKIEPPDNEGDNAGEDDGASRTPEPVSLEEREPDESHPVPRVQPTGPSDEDDPEPCEGCGYDLRGLPMGRECPECGRPKRKTVVTGFEEPLAHMQMSVIRRVRLLTAIGMLTVFITIAVALIAYLSPQSSQLMWMLLAALALNVGTWVLTPAIDLREAAVRGFSSSGRLRYWSRLLQIVWFPAAVLVTLPALVQIQSPVVEGMLFVLALVCIAIGIAGIIVLGLLLENLAEWARDDTAEWLFNIGEWGVGICGGVVLLATLLNMFLPGAGISVVIRFFAMFALLGIVVSVGALIIALTSLAKSVSLSVRHAVEYKERLHRQLKRGKEEQAGAVATD